MTREQEAKRCVDAGCEIIWVTNHAGRQVDGAIASLDALPGISKVIDKNRARIIFVSDSPMLYLRVSE